MVGFLGQNIRKVKVSFEEWRWIQTSKSTPVQSQESSTPPSRSDRRHLPSTAEGRDSKTKQYCCAHYAIRCCWSCDFVFWVATAYAGSTLSLSLIYSWAYLKVWCVGGWVSWWVGVYVCVCFLSGGESYKNNTVAIIWNGEYVSSVIFYMCPLSTRLMIRHHCERSLCRSLNHLSIILTSSKMSKYGTVDGYICLNLAEMGNKSWLSSLEWYAIWPLFTEIRSVFVAGSRYWLFQMNSRRKKYLCTYCLKMTKQLSCISECSDDWWSSESEEDG